MSRRLQEYENIRRQFEQTWSVAELERRKRSNETKERQRESPASGPAPLGQQESSNFPITQENAAPPPQPQPHARHRSLSDIQSENATTRQKDEGKTGISAWFQKNTQHVQPLTEPPP